jgi:hypothetical protein
MESLRVDLASGPVLFQRDELGGWCHQMGQYKQSNADRFDWCSFWSHSAVDVGRKSGERVRVKEPFVAVTGMMVPASARELNYRGQADDGFVHRMLLAYLEAEQPVATLAGVPDDLTQEYKRRMTRLFDPPKISGKPANVTELLKSAAAAKVLTFEPKALRMLMKWANGELFRYLRAPRNDKGEIELIPEMPEQDAPGWLVSKYRKLYENCLRMCLVLHELWRVAGAWKPPEGHDDAEWYLDRRDYEGKRVKLDPMKVDCETVERAIAVIDYFRGHILSVQGLLGEEVDDVDKAHNRLRSTGLVTVRQVIRQTTYRTRDRVLALFGEWAKRGYGKVTYPRKNQVVFDFNA